MVAIHLLDRAPRSLLRKAAWLARSRGVGIRLVHIIALPYGPLAVVGANVRGAAREEVKDAKARLLKFAGSSELRGLAVTSTVSWDYPAADGIIRQVLKYRPQLLLAQSPRHARIARIWLNTTCWELIRHCPCPVWLSKADLKVNGTVLAAIDPFHAHAKPDALDHVILRHAIEIAVDDPRRVLACHSYREPAPAIVGDAGEMYTVPMSEEEQKMSEEEQKKHRASVKRAVIAETTRYEIPIDNILVVAGDPAYQLPRVARKQNVNVVVMGAVSRSALKRMFIGHTAEQVIDELACDVLIVKPRGFKSSVAPRIRRSMALSAALGPDSQEYYDVSRIDSRRHDTPRVRDERHG